MNSMFGCQAGKKIKKQRRICTKLYYRSKKRDLTMSICRNRRQMSENGFMGMFIPKNMVVEDSASWIMLLLLKNLLRDAVLG